jgi:hypothetical protein
MIRALFLSAVILGIAGPASATSFVIGDNDGYGIGIPDNADHPFDGTCDPSCANVDNRSLAEALALDGAQYTDTYSTTHPGFGPQPGTVATFLFTGLTDLWTIGHLEIDMADFQASQFGAVITTFNGIVQNFAYNDGFPNTLIHHYDLDAAVIASINALDSLTITIDRNLSSDFYGFDYLSLNDFANPESVPEPASLLLFGTGLTGLVIAMRRRGKASRG